jgi:hypothetical protein
MTDSVPPPLRGLGLCTHFERRDQGWKVEHLLPLARQMGASTLRQEAGLWHRVEPARGQYELPEVEADWLQQATDAGLSVIPVLALGNPVYDNPMDPQAFARYAAFMARTLPGRFNIEAFEIWNEPTNFQFMGHYGGSWSGAEPCLWLEKFAELVALSARAIKDEAPDVPVMISPGEPQFFHMAMRYPESLEHVDAVGVHPYPNRFPPETAVWGGPQIERRDGVSVADDDHSHISLWRRLREHCRQYLGREPKTYANEYGYSTYDHSRKGANAAGYTEQAQAKYLARGLVLALAAGVEVVCVYDFMDDGLDRYELEHNFGLVRHEERGYEPKPAWHALRRVSQALAPAWEHLAAPPARLDVTINPLPCNKDQWQQPPVEPHLRITGPQAHWFIAGDAWVSFVWRAGRLSGEYNDPLGAIVWDDAPQFAGVEMSDLYTGEALPARPSREAGCLVLPDVPVGGSPVAVRWTPKSGKPAAESP